MISAEELKGSISYGEYSSLIERLLQEGKSTGDSTPEHVESSKLNIVRMKRLDKTTRVTPDLLAAIRRVSTPTQWIVITEGWCGDAAQCVPVLHAIARHNEHIHFRILLRDENPAVMDRYLTNGSRSIPVLVVQTTASELFRWGPRPAKLQELVLEMKRDGVEKKERSLRVQNWYNSDRTKSIQAELLALIGGQLAH